MHSTIFDFSKISPSFLFKTPSKTVSLWRCRSFSVRFAVAVEQRRESQDGNSFFQTSSDLPAEVRVLHKAAEVHPYLQHTQL